jgi:transposase InsO family protein
MSQYKIELKFKIVVECLDTCEHVCDVARRYGVSRASIHRWIKRFKEKGFEGLRDLSRAPICVRNKTSELVEGLVVRLRSENGLRYGPLRISFLMRRFHDITICPSTVYSILKRYGLNRRDFSVKSWKRFERGQPNQMWATDIKGGFTIKGVKGKFYPVPILDDCSRYVLSCGLYQDMKADQINDQLVETIKQFGPPKEMLTDNGPQFIPTKDQKSKAEFGKILDSYSVKHRRTGVCKPNTNGKVERFNRTLQDEFINVVHMENYEDAKNKLDEFIRFYNFNRPHQGIKGKTPAERFMTNNKHNQGNHVVRNGPGQV